MKSSLIKTTLCALLLATTLSSASAQKKKSSSLSSIVRAGFSLSSSLNPVVSLGIGFGSEANHNKGSFSTSGNIGMFIGGIPFRKYSESFSISNDWLDKKYTVENKVIPVAEYTLLFSSGSFSLGGGVISAKKSGHTLKSSYPIPDGDLYGISSSGYNVVVLGYTLKGGASINKFLPEIKNPLYLEFTVNRIPKSPKNLPEKIREGDKSITSFSLGIVGEFIGEKR